MDPLSLAASIIAIVTLAKEVTAAISGLRSACKSLPGRLHAVHNEVADFELVLFQLAELVEKRACLPDSEQSAIPHLLKQARSKLHEIHAIVRTLTSAYLASRSPLVGANVWRKEQGKLQALQEDIRTVKCSLNIMLGASNSQDMLRIRLDVQAISAVTTQSSEKQIALSEKFLTTLSGVDERIARVENLLESQANNLRSSQSMQVGSLYDSLRPEPKRPLLQTRQGFVESAEMSDMGVRVTPYIVSCQAGCPCSCHLQRRSSSPHFLSNVLGRLTIGIAGVPVLNAKCDDDACRGSPIRQVNLEYWFPLGFWSTIVRMQVTYGLSMGPTLNLEALRRVPDSAMSVNFAVAGNIEGLKHLFRQGRASPRDVSTTRGYSLLRWALYSKQYATCIFLMRAGADSSYRPIAASDNSPRIKACHFLLEGGNSEETNEALRTITNSSEYLDDFIDDSGFTVTHRIVLGLSLKILEEELILHPEDIDVQDSMGRTPLAWAAARGDNRAVVTLLRYGADPNIMDVQLSGPLSNSAAQEHTTCVSLLLDAGADPEPALPRSIQKGSPLSVAARNAKDPLLAKRLLDFGANVNSCTTDGRTPLFHAAKNDDTHLAILLLEYGADINYISVAGESPLTMSIIHNSHSVLRLLLERWHEYSVCPRLKGPHLLEIAASYADFETLQILADTDHFRHKYDKHFTIGDFRSRLTERPDMSAKLALAFDQLLSIINATPCSLEGGSSPLKAAFFSCLSSRSNTFDQSFERPCPVDTQPDESDDSSDLFHDALSFSEVGHRGWQ
ncbi:ankyrin repeat-containing domain protein [Xylaria sp. FL1042]|nr:ankyrin repeat-containing domain protein [Xylaria sp. FL1042]